MNYIENEEAFVLKLANQKIYKYYTILEKLKAINPFTYKNNEELLFELENIESPEIQIEDKITEIDLVEDIHTYLRTKSADIRKIFYLYYSLDLTISDIALELGFSESNVKNKLYRTLSEIRNKYNLRSEYDERKRVD